ncbi:MAG: HPr family phosphocarrier protein [archaeon]|nr:HPr family phosphocarrier protein [archaeon]
MLEQKFIQEEDYTTAKVKVADELGLHARPCTLIAKCCLNYSRRVYLVKTEEPQSQYNCKEIMNMMTMEANNGTPIKIYVQGINDEAKEVCKNIAKVISSTLEEITAEFEKEMRKKYL